MHTLIVVTNVRYGVLVMSERITTLTFHRVQRELLYYLFLTTDDRCFGLDIIPEKCSSEYWTFLRQDALPSSLCKKDVELFLSHNMIMLVGMCYEYLGGSSYRWEQVREDFAAGVNGFFSDTSELIRMKKLLQSLIIQCEKLRSGDLSAEEISDQLRTELSWAYDTLVADFFCALGTRI